MRVSSLPLTEWCPPDVHRIMTERSSLKTKSSDLSRIACARPVPRWKMHAPSVITWWQRTIEVILVTGWIACRCTWKTSRIESPILSLSRRLSPISRFEWISLELMMVEFESREKKCFTTKFKFSNFSTYLIRHETFMFIFKFFN